MSGGDRVIRWSTAFAVLGVAAVAAVASYEHAYDLVRAHGESGWTARLVPLTVDGLIYASSMVMLDSARRKTPVPALARWLLGLGYRGDPRGQRRARLGPWPRRRGGGRMARSCAGRLVRTPHDGHPEFPGSGGRHSRDRARCGPAAGAGGRVVRWATGGGPGSLGARDPRSAPRRPAPGTEAARLPRHGSCKAGGKTCSVSNLRGGASSQRPRLRGNCSAQVTAVCGCRSLRDRQPRHTAGASIWRKMQLCLGPGACFWQVSRRWRKLRKGVP